jgi:hypothetical protein
MQKIIRIDDLVIVTLDDGQTYQKNGITDEEFNVIADWTVTGFKNKLYSYLCSYGNLNNCILHPLKT